MLSMFNSLWSWMPGPLPFICSTICLWFFILILAKLIKLLVEFIKDVIGIVKTLLLRWGIGL